MDHKNEFSMAQRQMKRLVYSLSSLRCYEEADVILECENVEFPAHKLVLKASCPYFNSMFQCNMKETISDKIVIQQVKHEALGAILDYLYIGKVPEISDGNFLLNLTEAAHMFQLLELFDYCCSNLPKWLSKENVENMFSLAVLYDQKDVLYTVTEYIEKHIDSLIGDNRLSDFSQQDLKEFISLTTSKGHIMEEIVLVIINWLCHDLATREIFADDLLKYINVNCLRREFMKYLLDSAELKGLSLELSHKIKDLAVTVFYELSAHYYNGLSLLPRCSEACQGAKLLFFSDHCLELSFDPNINGFVKCTVPFSCIQHLDLCTMSWYPLEKLPFPEKMGSAVCQHGDCIYLVGGDLNSHYIMYHVTKNVVRYIPCNHFNGRKGGVLLPLHDHIYFFDEKFNVSKITPSKDVCVENYFVIPSTWSNYKVFATTNWIYISFFDYTDEYDSLKMMRFTDNNGQIRCQNLTSLPGVNSETSVFFTVSNNSSKLYAFYQMNGCLVRARNKNAQIENWEIENFPMGPSKICEFYSLYKTSQSGQEIVILVTTAENEFHLTPDYQIDPETCKWTKLPPPKWKCDIPGDGAVQKVYFVQ